MNIIAYRLSGESKYRIFEAEEACIPIFDKPREGFLIAPFDPDKNPFFYGTRRSLKTFPADMIRDNVISFPFREFTRSEYFDYIETIKSRLEGKEDRKIVASRRKKVTLKTSPHELFHSLCDAYPDAFVFLISTKEFGTWVGATPEMLLEKEGPRIKSMALAGTRPAGTLAPWDRKNLLEQEIVTQRISSVFKKNDLKVCVGKKTTLKAGPIEHIMTPIKGEIPGKREAGFNVMGLLRDLSPTPALAGDPRYLAIETIKEKEGDRVLYGGYLGPVFPNGHIKLNVTLRCAYLGYSTSHEEDNSGPLAVLFGGGGITSYSSPEDEWAETERKMDILLPFLNPGR